MVIKALLETFLVEIIPNKANTASENEQSIECTDLDVLMCFFNRKGTRVTKQVNKEDSNSTIPTFKMSVYTLYRKGMFCAKTDPQILSFHGLIINKNTLLYLPPGQYRAS